MVNSTETPMQHGKESESIDLLSALRTVRSAGGALCTQATLYGKLLRIEWLEEKNRLIKMTLLGLMAFACTLCAILFLGILIVVLSWETNYRILALTSLTVLYSIGTAIAWYYLRKLSTANKQSFAATREELLTDMALIKSRL